MEYDSLEEMINSFCDSHHDQRAKHFHPIEAKIDHPNDPKTYVKLAYEAAPNVDEKDGFRLDKEVYKRVMKQLKATCRKYSSGNVTLAYGGVMKADEADFMGNEVDQNVVHLRSLSPCQTARLRLVTPLPAHGLLPTGLISETPSGRIFSSFLAV
ncbi:hypothetical protein EX30DRAFT_352254 [Ascodesmis nigricans]|uniref:Uncharacterized protein n=1 Tax=Ascodesmis nigricans TaxID=341454 RepID=A0A4S2MQS1_9PEZI|nr:hypothetical protein EX30DRAFT_352254 [Ascodesmis nigricans]